LGFTISERPIFLCNLQQVDEYILPPQTKALVQTVCDRFVKALFLFDGSPLVERQLDEYAIFGSLDAEISRIKNEAFDWMFCDHLKAIILRDVENIDHRVVDCFADDSSVIG
jgi:hypothetical protein